MEDEPYTLFTGDAPGSARRPEVAEVHGVVVPPRLVSLTTYDGYDSVVYEDDDEDDDDLWDFTTSAVDIWLPWVVVYRLGGYLFARCARERITGPESPTWTLPLPHVFTPAEDIFVPGISDRLCEHEEGWGSRERDTLESPLDITLLRFNAFLGTPFTYFDTDVDDASVPFLPNQLRRARWTTTAEYLGLWSRLDLDDVLHLDYARPMTLLEWLHAYEEGMRRLNPPYTINIDWVL